MRVDSGSSFDEQLVCGHGLLGFEVPVLATIGDS